MRCADCQWKYPESILDHMMVGGIYTDPICGLCALERANQVSGVKRKFFQGEQAEHNRLSAIRHRKRFPNDAPKVM